LIFLRNNYCNGALFSRRRSKRIEEATALLYLKIFYRKVSMITFILSFKFRALC